MNKINSMFLRLAFGLTCVALAGGCGKGSAGKTSANGTAESGRTQEGVDAQVLSMVQRELEDVLVPECVAGGAASVDDNGGQIPKSLEAIRALYQGKLIAKLKTQGMSQSQIAATLLSTYAGIHSAGIAELKQQSKLHNTDGSGKSSNPREQFVALAAAESWDAFKQQLQLAVANDPKALNIHDAHEQTPLMWACMRYDLKLAKWLVEKGADLKATNDGGLTPLMIAVAFEKSEVVRLLIGRGADVNAATSEGVTSLMRACDSRQPQTINELLRAGANANATDSNGTTALMYAAASGNAQAAQTLLEKGAKRDSKDASRKTALDYALQKQQQDVVKLLQ